ncbi:MAG: hypothetical protein ABI653_06260, partial [Bacteroidota bacterium]
MMHFKSFLSFNKKAFSTLAIACCSSLLFAQMPTNGLDVKHYAFYISLNDSNNIIYGKAVITTGFTEKLNQVQLDLVNKNEAGKGMSVTEVLKNNMPMHFVQDAQHLLIDDNCSPGMENTYTIN